MLPQRRFKLPLKGASNNAVKHSIAHFLDMTQGSSEHLADTLGSAAGQRPAYRILLHHDGNSHVAEVPELPSCRALADSPAAALQAAQDAIAVWLQRAEHDGASPPELLSPVDLARAIRNRLAAFIPAPRPSQRVSPVKLMLVKKFGKMSNRELASHVGLHGRDAPTALSAAASGKGTRKARCAIAITLHTPPSVLWPERPAAVCQDDDDAYFSLMK